jgi:hypothetical protein
MGIVSPWRVPCPALPAALGPKTATAASPHYRPPIAPCIPVASRTHAGATECIGSGEKSRDDLSLIGTNSDMPHAPSLHDYHKLQTAFEIRCNHLKMNDGAFYNR